MQRYGDVKEPGIFGASEWSHSAAAIGHGDKNARAVSKWRGKLGAGIEEAHVLL